MLDPVWMEILCTALTVSYAGNPYTVLLLPKGSCELCCPYKRNDIKLYLSQPGGPEEVYFDWENGTDWKLLDNNRTIAVYIHGFTEQHTGPAASEIKLAYRERGEDNLLLVDWSPLAAAPWYNAAVSNTYHTADFLAGVIDALVLQGLPLARFHIIGFSLGAEIAGLLAKRISVGKLTRITGLDPALPLYDPAKPSGRLAKTDAAFVDVIHTDGGIFGFDSPMGHADFFPNGGRPAQPGCRAEILVHTNRLNDFIACSHNRAWKYYAESVRDPLAFPAYKCHSFLAFQKGKCKTKDGNVQQAYMGYRADPSLKGRYFLATKDTGPYGLGPHEHSYPTRQELTFTSHHSGPQAEDSYPPVKEISTPPDPHNNIYYGNYGTVPVYYYDPSYLQDLHSSNRRDEEAKTAVISPSNYPDSLSPIYFPWPEAVSDGSDVQTYQRRTGRRAETQQGRHQRTTALFKNKKMHKKRKL